MCWCCLCRISGKEWPPNMTNGHVLLRGPESSPRLQSTILTTTVMVGCIMGDGGETRGGGWGGMGGGMGGNNNNDCKRDFFTLRR